MYTKQEIRRFYFFYYYFIPNILNLYVNIFFFQTNKKERSNKCK
jgi:hypothetical protein